MSLAAMLVKVAVPSPLVVEEQEIRYTKPSLGGPALMGVTEVQFWEAVASATLPNIPGYVWPTKQTRKEN